MFLGKISFCENIKGSIKILCFSLVFVQQMAENGFVEQNSSEKKQRICRGVYFFILINILRKITERKV
jgi:hypothetical protein